MPAKPPIADISRLSLDEIAKIAAEQTAPPVESWNPPDCGESQIVIRRDGSWWHDGGKIEREALVRLFASILRREPDESYVLVTPAEKQRVTVEDAPFLAVEMKAEGTGAARTIAFRLNTGEVVVAGADHPIRFADAPYLMVRRGLEARIERAVYYDLAEIALEEGENPVGIWSAGAFFPLEVAP